MLRYSSSQSPRFYQTWLPQDAHPRSTSPLMTPAADACRPPPPPGRPAGQSLAAELYPEGQRALGNVHSRLQSCSFTTRPWSLSRPLSPTV
ncbi:hypothetical protein E2C01_075183 [Portunus trituberculatus]|uniref:Uncharacterized protein n=1 Tax=Portunus trituberculatus TaxID=210409 RepID=A0A5B7I7U6_PORTR|nr:hypothetical protein [Portunus trituberculatus]